MEHIGIRIKNRREQLGMTQEELSELMGYKSRSTIAKIEKGVNDVYQSNIVKFAEVLNTSIAYLMDWDNESLNELEESQKQANAYQDEVETELAPLFEMNLTKEEAQELVKYAKFLVSQRG